MYILFIITLFNFGGLKPIVTTQEFSTLVRFQEEAQKLLTTYPNSIEAYCVSK